MMADEEIPSPIPCWLVWQRADDNGRPYLVSVDTSEELANLHVKAIMDEAKWQDRVVLCHVEQSWINHRYGESMGQGFDALKKMMVEMRDAIVKERRDDLPALHLADKALLGIVKTYLQERDPKSTLLFDVEWRLTHANGAKKP